MYITFDVKFPQGGLNPEEQEGKECYHFAIDS